MKKKLFLFTFIVMALVCVLAISVSAEIAYINANGEQVSAEATDIAYELEFRNPFETGGNCRLEYIYLHDTSITKIVVPEIEFTNSKGVVYKMAEYSFVRLSTGWGDTLSVYAIGDKETKANSLHAQIKELELHIPVLADGAGSKGNLAGWSGLEKLSFYKRAYEPQNKGGFLNGCTSIKELHFYGENNELSGNFFPSTMNEGGKVVFYENASGIIKGSAMQGLNGKDVTVYMNTIMQPQDKTDPRLTWNKKGNALKFVLLVNDKSGYTEEQIASYETIWQAGNNKSENNAKYSMPINTYCEFYNNHLNLKELSSCTSKCLVCNEFVIPENATHNIETAINYESFAKDGQIIVGCVNEGCTHKTTETAPALFTCTGFSASQTGTNGIVLGFKVNQEAINAYTSATGNTIKYGVFVGTQASLGNSDLSDESLSDKVIIAEIKQTDFKVFDIKIMGFETEDQKSTSLAIGGYVAETDDEGTTYSYMQLGTPSEGEKYCYDTYNNIVSALN
ncbi:MAG: hypothetical protein J6D23_06225 [Clostridia bacterium]|nr:hypothetical protein [Clostridia bacterium]